MQDVYVDECPIFRTHLARLARGTQQLAQTLTSQTSRTSETSVTSQTFVTAPTSLWRHRRLWRHRDVGARHVNGMGLSRGSRLDWQTDWQLEGTAVGAGRRHFRYEVGWRLRYRATDDDDRQTGQRQAAWPSFTAIHRHTPDLRLSVRPEQRATVKHHGGTANGTLRYLL